MRTWRVGTFSMGISLVFLGMFLFLTQFFEWSIITVLKVWWPIILVILGLEILLYLFSSKQEKPYLSFDLFSIIMVGIIGAAGTCMVLLQASGLAHFIEQGVNREEVTKDLPKFTYEVSESIDRIVLESENQQNPLTIEGTNEKDLSLFGTYRASKSDNLQIKKPEDYLQVTQKGDTLYIYIKEMPSHQSDFLSTSSTLQATILVPTNKKLEILNMENEVIINPRDLKNNWTVNNASNVGLYLNETNNVKVSVENTVINNRESDKWEDKSKDNNTTNATLQKGKGSSSISVYNSGELEVTNY